MEKENNTIETITQSYEEKIANREKEILAEKEALKKELEQKFEEEKKELSAQHNKEIADIILGRKSVEEVEKNDRVENDEKSFFDKMVEETKQNLGITKGGKS